MNNKSKRVSLWKWICVRVISQSVGVVVIIALCMWLRYAIYSTWVLYHEMPVDIRKEFLHLLNNPNEDLYRFYSLFHYWYGIDFANPSITSGIGLCWLFWWSSLYLSWSYWGSICRGRWRSNFPTWSLPREKSLRGFSVQAKLEDKAPEELLTLTHDFNEMTKN